MPGIRDSCLRQSPPQPAAAVCRCSALPRWFDPVFPEYSSARTRQLRLLQLAKASNLYQLNSPICSPLNLAETAYMASSVPFPVQIGVLAGNVSAGNAASALALAVLKIVQNANFSTFAGTSSGGSTAKPSGASDASGKDTGLTALEFRDTPGPS